jgi:WD40 repeat protein
VIGDEKIEVDSVEFDYRGSRILTVCGDGTAKLWDADASKVLYELRAETGAVQSASFSRDGSRLLTTHAGGAARLWSADNGEPLLEASVGERVTPRAALSPDGSRLAYASGSGDITVLDTASKSSPAHISGAGEINSIVFGPRGERILIGSDDREVRLFDLAQNRLLGIIEGHSPSFSPKGDRLLTVDGANLKIWSTSTFKLLSVLRGHTNKVFSADFDPTGRSIVSVAQGESPRLWNVGPDERNAESILAEVGGRLRWRLEEGNLVPASGTGEPSLQEQSE